MTDKKPDNLMAALAKAQAELTAPSKNREVEVKMKSGGKYTFKYATLDHLIEHIRKPLTDQGLWFIQFTQPNAMVTRITHESGEHFDASVPMPNLPNSPQEAGSILSYFRRYSLATAFALASDEDDDANVAEGNGYSQQSPAKQKAEQAVMTISDDDWARIVSLGKATNTTTGALKKEVGAANLKTMTKEQLADAFEYLENKLAEAAKAESDAKHQTLADELGDEIPY